MSLFSGIFGSGNKKQKAPSTLEAIAKLKETTELLEKKSAHIENKVQAEILTAKKNASKNKRVALQALKRKKRLDKQLLQIDGTLSTLEFQIDALENANTNVEVLSSMKFASEALKDAQMDPDDVHDIMDDMAEQQELQQEIGDTLAQFGQRSADYDEDELEAELQQLENEDIETGLPELENLDKLPDAPVSELPKVKSKKMADDDDMKELAAWAS